MAESGTVSPLAGAAPLMGSEPEGLLVGIIANRGSGNGASRALARKLAVELGALGLKAEIAWNADERRALVHEASASTGWRCLVAVGGDGTVSALINEQPRIPITVLPAGTENLGAHHFGLKRNPAWLARTITSGRIARTDLGLAAGRRFLLMTGFGFDGDVVTRHHLSRVTKTGAIKPTHRAAYVEPILRSSFCYRFPSISVTIPGAGQPEVLSGTTVFVFNLPRYALGLPFAPHARQDDGLLDVVIFREPGAFQALYYLWRVLWKSHLDHPGVSFRRVRKVTLSAGSRIPVQLDGDPGGYLAPTDDPTGREGWTIEVLPGAIDVLVPAPRNRGRLPLPLARRRIPG